MAKHKRRAPNGKPITSHRLFPAVVALWFGALFGLGSLAVRPSLLEGLVLKSHIDLVLPAAAPPLGATARVLVALVMAALGGLIGLVIARRLGPPRSAAAQRAGQEQARDESPDADRADISDADEVDSPGGVLAARRWTLETDHGEAPFVPYDMAPLPGGNPQVFDISELGMDVSLPLTEEAATPASEAERQVFQASPCPASEAAHADGRQVFGMRPHAAKPESERQIFGAVATDTEPLELPAASQEPLPDLASLGMTELAERLTDAMRRRRAARVDVGTEIEPVVIFPGQPAVPAPASQVQPVIAAPDPAIDSDKAERALQTALSNLQRLSGAA